MEKDLVPPEKVQGLRLRNLQKLVGYDEEEARDLVDMLMAPTPVEPDEFGKWIDTRPARGGTMVSYVPGHRFIQRMNDCFGFLWSHTVKGHFEKDGQIVSLDQVKVEFPGRTITRRHPDGTEETVRFDGFAIVKEQFGSSEIKRYSSEVKDRHGNIKHKRGDVIDLGDDYKGASTDAMKKCITGFGMFHDVYGPREGGEEGVVAKAQLDVLYIRGEEAGMTDGETKVWAEKELETSLYDADPFDIMGLIPRLIEMAKERKSG